MPVLKNLTSLTLLLRDKKLIRRNYNDSEQTLQNWLHPKYEAQRVWSQFKVGETGLLFSFFKLIFEQKAFFEQEKSNASFRS